MDESKPNPTRTPFPIPVRAAKTLTPASTEAAVDLGHCAESEPFALMVLGDSMQPEFMHGEIIVIEPTGVAHDGSFVIADAQDELIFRQLIKHPEGWMLKPVNPLYPNIPIENLDPIKGVIVLKKVPGKRKEAKHYA